MRTLGFLTWVPLLVGCRFGFQERPDDPPPEPPPPDVAIDAMELPDASPPAVLACGAATKFSVVAAPSTLAATATTDGYSLITSDGTNIRGYSYRFEGTTLVAQRGDVPLFTGTSGALTAIADGAHTLLAIATGDPEPTATTLIALGEGVMPLGMPVPHQSWVGAAGSLARNDAGTLVLLATKIEGTVPTGEVDVRTIGSDGAPIGPTHIAIADGGSPSIAPAGDNFLVTWNAYSETSNKVRASVIAMTSDSLVTRLEPKIISTALTEDAFNARGAYGANGSYLIAWMEKPGPLDHIKASLRDRNLVEIGPQLDLGNGNQPFVIAGKDDFLVVWRIDGTRLGAARVRPDGSVTQMPIESAGGDVIGMDLVTRAGQAALVWIERGAAGGATVRFDPVCTP